MTEREQWEKEMLEKIQRYEKYIEEHVESRQVTPEMVQDMRDRNFLDPEKIAEFCLAIWKISMRLDATQGGGWDWDKDLTTIVNEQRRLYWKQCPLYCGWRVAEKKDDEKEKDDD